VRVLGTALVVIFRFCGNDLELEPTASFVPEFCRVKDDYQSGSKHPHSKGCRHFNVVDYIQL